MPRVRDLLYRLRPSGAPGAANPSGVPADRAREAADELAPVFALLEPVEEDCHRIEVAGQQDAEDQRAHDREVARDLLASALARAPVEREAARARAQRSADERTAAAAEHGQAGAARVRRRAEEQLPHYVDLVVSRVWDLVAQPDGQADPQPDGQAAARAIAQPDGQPGGGPSRAPAVDDRPSAGFPHDADVGP